MTAVTRAGRIEARHVHIEVGDGAQRIEAVREASFVIRPGEFVCLLGPSGCGKSTLLAALAGHLGTARGTLTLHGTPIAGPDPQRGLVFQQHTLFPWKTVLDNVAFGPFGALDALTRARMQEQLLALWARLGTTVVFVTHDIDEALFLADRLFIMSAPRPAEAGRPPWGSSKVAEPHLLVSPRLGCIVEDLAVTLPRPRTAELTTEAGFNALKRHCLAVLKQISNHDPLPVRP